MLPSAMSDRSVEVERAPQLGLFFGACLVSEDRLHGVTRDQAHEQEHDRHQADDGQQCPHEAAHQIPQEARRHHPGNTTLDPLRRRFPCRTGLQTPVDLQRQQGHADLGFGLVGVEVDDARDPIFRGQVWVELPGHRDLIRQDAGVVETAI